MKGEHIQTYRVYYRVNEGVVGTLFITNTGDYRVYGSIVGKEQTFQYTEEYQFIGVSGIMDNGHIGSISIIS